MPSADEAPQRGNGPHPLFALIPAHNEAKTIREVVEQTLPHVEGVIVVDDGSSDGTAEAVASTAATLIQRSVNGGKGAALLDGMANAFGEAKAAAVITLDADRQHDPASIQAFRDAASRAPGALILGDRSAGFRGMALNRAWGIAFGNFFIGWASKQRVRDAQCGMRLYPRAVWEKARVPEKHSQGFLFETAILIYAADSGTRFATVPIEARREGYVLRPSHFHPIWDFIRIFALVTRLLAARGFRPRGLLIALGLLR
ncbi:MAG: glycosyltransferase family 2 protein [Pseudomonadota bacterium]